MTDSDTPPPHIRNKHLSIDLDAEQQAEQREAAATLDELVSSIRAEAEAGLQPLPERPPLPEPPYEPPYEQLLQEAQQRVDTAIEPYGTADSTAVGPAPLPWALEGPLLALCALLAVVVGAPLLVVGVLVSVLSAPLGTAVLFLAGAPMALVLIRIAARSG